MRTIAFLLVFTISVMADGAKRLGDSTPVQAVAQFKAPTIGDFSMILERKLGKPSYSSKQADGSERIIYQTGTLKTEALLVGGKLVRAQIQSPKKLPPELVEAMLQANSTDSSSWLEKSRGNAWARSDDLVALVRQGDSILVLTTMERAKDDYWFKELLRRAEKSSGRELDQTSISK